MSVTHLPYKPVLKIALVCGVVLAVALLVAIGLLWFYLAQTGTLAETSKVTEAFFGSVGLSTGQLLIGTGGLLVASVLLTELTALAYLVVFNLGAALAGGLKLTVEVLD